MDVDIAIVGSGFSGSLMAMIARRIGCSVALIERGKHPRFAIGESSTPLANLLLEEIARSHDLPALRPLCKWGSWQREYPRIACGLKRGFTFYHHTAGMRFDADGKHELLVGANPCDEIADTHWYRPDFDAFMAGEARALGAQYLDEAEARLVTLDNNVIVEVTRGGARDEIRANFLVDASGPRGFMHRSLDLSDDGFPAMQQTQALFAHFTGVRRWEDISPCRGAPPYPPDDAALHHVFEGGWMWVLRFNNGITSAGIAVTDSLAAELRLEDGEAAWQRFMERFPSVREQFETAEAVTPFVHQRRVAARSSLVAGRNWAMLPSAAGFVNPLLSTGFPMTLLGITRLAEIICSTDRESRLADYAGRTHAELDATSRLVGTLYANMASFESFSALSMLYFATASFSESARRLGKPEQAGGFLMHDHPRFGPELRACCDAALNQCDDRLVERIHRAVEPFDVAGLSRRERAPWFPCLAEDFLSAAHKLGATREDAAAALSRAGFGMSQ